MIAQELFFLPSILPQKSIRLPLMKNPGCVYCLRESTVTETVIHISGDKAELLGVISVKKSTHAIALDPKTHALWISYSRRDGRFQQNHHYHKLERIYPYFNSLSWNDTKLKIESR